MNIRALSFIGLVSICFGAVQGFSATPQELFDQANALYISSRDNPAMLQDSEDKLKLALSAVQDDDLKFDILILSSRVIYYKTGKMASKTDKLAGYEASYSFAKDAQDLNPDLAEGFYWYSVALGRWAEQKGVFESLSRKKELFENLDSAQQKLTRDGQMGETVDGYGPDRIYGRVYYKLPSIAGGSRSKSLDHLKNAYNNAPENFMNAQYYIETLGDGGSSAEKKLACQIADEYIAKDVGQYPVDRIPESAAELIEIKALRASIRCP
jgi:hypothetical protein